MLHLTSAGTSATSLVRMSSAYATSLSQSRVGFNNGQETPFAQQFNYHLQDLAIVRRKQNLKPDGTVRVHLPNITCVHVEYNRRETVEIFRERLQELIPDFKVKDYYLVSPRGAIEDGMTLDEYSLTPGIDILMIRKGVKNRQQLKNRRFWLQSREKALNGEARPETCSMPRPTFRKHPITPYRQTDEELELSQLPRLANRRCVSHLNR